MKKKNFYRRVYRCNFIQMIALFHLSVSKLQRDKLEESTFFGSKDEDV